ncbi:hypothetical protein [Mycolicibacterium arseniciresistens]|uniref:Uncharacterized protein n=1 Tax=Mycolicibacterium arseniciresistens TaxID=3062257 RepID=A0ABT8UDY6_9MYCO|nr:hypothetical protein [Mycolicibacterium arseniciresistens]MDO3636005.1 hypothetical protein [Mycolicibacterium arseniciresistens]
MTEPGYTPPGDIEITAAWPSAPHTRSLVANLSAFQWDQDRAGVYLMFGAVGVPIWLSDQDRDDWLAAHPDHRIPVEPIASVYMNKERVTDLVMKLGAHIGLRVENPGGSDAE